MTDTTAKKDVQKLQRAIVDGLEDVKAQDIVVFNTEHLSALFERVVVASGTSNRQTKALAASVRDKVRDAGFPKPRVEGEENGEWIIIDCGQAVVHVMQPAIRQYYHLEEIWGDKPVRLKLGAPKPVSATVTTRASSAKPSAGEKKPARAKTQSSSARAPQAAGKVPAKSATRAAGGAASAPSRKAKPATASAKPAARQPAAKKSAASPRTRTTSKA
ncbi:MAG: ribosome silencing factor [Limnohabitans sp.]|nr:ribosome silencing factor [Limnohabitans sp.]